MVWLTSFRSASVAIGGHPYQKNLLSCFSPQKPATRSKPMIKPKADTVSAILNLKPFNKIPLLQKSVQFIHREGVKSFLLKAWYYLNNNRNMLGNGIQESGYSAWIKKNSLQRSIIESEISRFKTQPKISIIMPVYNVEIKWLMMGINSVRNQIYQNWELCIVDDCSTDHRIHEYLTSIITPKIKIGFLEQNRGIAVASNRAIEMSSGEYIGLMDHDDEITFDALFEVVKAINLKDPDLIYSDEDKLDRKGERKRPFFKPDWSPDLLRAQNYICHFAVLKKSILRGNTAFREGFEGAQDHDLFLRISEQTDKIYHIPKVLYSWREIETSTAGNPFSKPTAQTAGLRAVSEHLKRVFKPEAFSAECQHRFVYDARYPLNDDPLISIIIPTKDKLSLLSQCVGSIIEKSIYENYEIILLDNQSQQFDTKAWLQKISTTYSHVRVVKASYPFCWSKLNNHGIAKAEGDVFVFLNNDTKIISADWMERLVEQAMREDVGVVGPLMLYPDGTIQHAGVVVGHGGWADHVFKGMHPVHYGSPYVSPMVKRNVLAVSGSCMAISRKTIEQIGNFNENFLICGSDVEICIRAHENGFYNIYDPSVRLFHYESRTRSPHDIPPCDFEMSQKHYKHYREQGGDPFFNINLSLTELKPTLN